MLEQSQLFRSVCAPKTEPQALSLRGVVVAQSAAEFEPPRKLKRAAQGIRIRYALTETALANR